MAVITIVATRDTHLHSGFQDASQESPTFIVHGFDYVGDVKSGAIRALVNFDLSAIAASTVNTALLRRTIRGIGGAGGTNGRLSRCTRPADWVEAEATWRNYRAGNAWTTAGGDFDDAGPPAAVTYTEPIATGLHTITGLAALAQDALDNRGNLLSLITRILTDTGVDNWYEWDPSEDVAPWEVEIDYTPPAGAAQTDLMRGRWG